ncbi:ATP-binding cassette domain-containing protein [Achromobacter ruhlandii]|jgi:branched-chain amino acid transport system ATP-binding protein|uniref:ABC transporter ATP-binding protein n=1 Tax=Achromobacter TaxID=222 RepID=UPI001466C758|nr:MULTISPECIES: ATP-binding cassette domain-containing protein [Achromobacter]MCV6796805.1 ATP-binding cassette domain-containing protein [Achromobacter ruhlandii]MCV6800972.1 ATP-binding cassette domain-containing protein [Achromobacter ruhlandii]MCV6809869.1 ATP-binding cassette domain-containing protein [Achromobacter ruhlandii]MCV6819118.1 ATP-binding cassette domain-containing protein [Achromobacter ruhlandii]CAB3874143.1 High-affinity branched-chain amino acid transport ATP-binding prot
MMLQASKLVAHIEGARVLREVDLDIRAGETVALIGRNGAGKTSLLRSIMGTLPLDEGGLLFQGQNLSKRDAYARAGLGIGFAPEERRLIGKFTVMENMMVPAWACRLKEPQVRERLDLIYSVAPELSQLAPRLGGLLSGGQQKMVALGRALMAGDNLVLLDEPFQGLAPALALRYADSLKTLRARKPDLAILITESNPKLLRPMADRVVTIERGEIISQESSQ